MNQTLLQELEKISLEEQRILDGDCTIQKNIYSSTNDFVIDSQKMLEIGRLIDIRSHTRFVHFPKHRHNYIEIIYMCSGSTLHIVNDKTSIKLETGDLLFLNQNAYHEIMPAAENDIAINFIILPEFFDQIFTLIDEENILGNFLIGTLQQEKSMVDYIYFPTHDITPIQNLVENLIWSILHKQSNNRNINQLTMGILFLQLLNYTDKINQNNPEQHEQNIIFTAMKYIEDHYKTATLTELSMILNEPSYYVSKLIKKHSNNTFKELLKSKRLTQAAYLLTKTKLPVEDIISIVGYDNTSYFHRIFKDNFKMTPKTYRNNTK